MVVSTRRMTRKVCQSFRAANKTVFAVLVRQDKKPVKKPEKKLARAVSCLPSGEVLYFY